MSQSKLKIEVEVENYRMIHDAIHGSFYLHKLLWKIIDTPEFQRLRNIKQTGNTHYVYDGANHTRFEHSIGVSHLCGVFLTKLKAKTDIDIISKKLILIMQIAGLCHDIGHCAFSHLFDNDIVPFFHPETYFCHEHASYQILKRLYYRLTSDFNEYGVFEEDIKLTGKIILGAPEKVPETLKSELEWTTEDSKLPFIFQILANEKDGIDVDKFDYIKRDCHNTGINTGFDPQRLMEFAYIDTSDQNQLKYLPKAAELIREMWDTRANLHRRVYQHRVVKCIDLMIFEVFKLVGHKVTINGVKLCDVHTNLDSYLLVTDHILTIIESLSSKTDREIQQAQQILADIKSRKLWKTIITVISSAELKSADLGDSVKYKIADDYVYHVFLRNGRNIPKTEIQEFITELEKNSSCRSIKIRLE